MSWCGPWRADTAGQSLTSHAFHILDWQTEGTEVYLWGCCICVPSLPAFQYDQESHLFQTQHTLHLWIIPNEIVFLLHVVILFVIIILATSGGMLSDSSHGNSPRAIDLDQIHHYWEEEVTTSVVVWRMDWCSTVWGVESHRTLPI